MLLFDSLVNFVSGLGTTRDKAASTTHGLQEMSHEELLRFYRSSWLSKKIINIPAFDAYRKWRNWQAQTDQITAIEETERRLKLRERYREADIKARLFGGSAIYIGTGDADPSQPFDYEKVQKDGIRFLNVFTPRDLSPGERIRDPESEWFNKPAYYDMNVGTTATPRSRIHPSRLIVFKGEDIPDEEFMPRMSGMGFGWGDSVLLARKDAILQAEATAANIASLIFEAKIDIMKIPNLMNSLANAQYKDLLLERVTLANTIKGINGALIMDSEEDYQQKSASFSSLADLMDRFFQQVSGAADIPMTRLFGQSAAGMNATGENDLRNYYDAVAAHQDLDITPVIRPLDEAVIRCALGQRDPDIHFAWASLWQISDKERSEIGKTNADTIKTLNDTQLFPPEAIAKAGATMLVENAILPGLEQEIDDAGGLPDYEMEAEAEAQQARELAAAANQNSSSGARSRVAANDGVPGPKTLYVRRDVVNGAAIAAHYAAQGLRGVKAENLHVTIIYTKKPVDWFATGESWQSKLTIAAGGARDHAMFGPPGLEDSLVLLIASSELRWRHESFKAAGAESSYDEYNPHITLRYNAAMSAIDMAKLDPWKGEIELGPEIYEEVKEKPYG